ncbi:MAG: DUF6763 family protein [Gammaproteobacteria bacterium]
MPTELQPIPGNWYQHLDKGREFQVIEIDEADAGVAIQYFDGDLEEIALDDWNELELEAIEAPEDWTGPVDDIELDDLGYSDTAMEPDDWAAPLEELRMVESADGTEPEPADIAELPPEQDVELVPYRE